MQKWWLIGAGVLGIALAVLLIPSPETGTPDGATAVVSPADGAGASADPEGRTRKVRKRGAGRASEGPNPLASEALRKRSVPEGRFAAKAGAPWTEIRRKLALQKVEGKPDPALDALVEEAAAMATRMGDLRRDPSKFDWAELEAQQRDLLARIRSSPYADAEIEAMAVLVEERVGEYHADKEKSATDAPTDATAPSGTASEEPATPE